LKAMIDSKVSEICTGMIDAVEAVVDAANGKEQVKAIRQKLIQLNLNILFGYQNLQDVRSLSRIIFEAGKEFILRTVNPFRIWWRWIANFRYILSKVVLISLFDIRVEIRNRCFLFDCDWEKNLSAHG
jgi:hypothetical protein